MLVLPSLGDVSHPFDSLVIGFLEDLQESHMQPRRGEHRHLPIKKPRVGWGVCGCARALARVLLVGEGRVVAICSQGRQKKGYREVDSVR